MKSFLLGLLSASSALAFLATAVHAKGNQGLVVNVTDIDAQDGSVIIALFDSEKSYETETATRIVRRTVSGDSLTVSFNRLAGENYAVKLFHDVNSNGELDTDLLGIPSEPYAFSNNARSPFSAPGWEEAKFAIETSQATQTIELR